MESNIFRNSIRSYYRAIGQIMTFSSLSLAGPDPNPMTHKEVEALKSLVSKEMTAWTDPIIANIGAERGTSTLAMLEERPDATIFSIDVNPCEGEFVNASKAGLDIKRIIRLLGPSQRIGQGWPFWVHFVWVDGDHSYEGVKGDIEAWLPKLMPKAIIAFHDYFEGEPPAHNPSGAGEAVRELMGDYELVCETERIRGFRK